MAVLELRGNYRNICRQLIAPLLNAIASFIDLHIERGSAIVMAAMALTLIVQPELSLMIEGSEFPG